MEKNYNIEKMRFISALMVVSIHILAYKYYEGTATFWNYYFTRYIFDFGVIFFFAVTGYFIYKKNSISYINKQINNVFYLFVYSNILYLLLKPFLFFIESLFLGSDFKTLLIAFLSGFSWNNLFDGTITSYHLWYFPASLIALFIFKFFKQKKLDPVSITFIAFALFAANSLTIIDLKVFTNYGGFTKALLSMSVGYLIAYLPYEIKYSNFLATIILILASVLARKINWFIGNISLYISVLLTINYCKYNTGVKNVFSNLGSTSLSIYIMHVFIYSLFDLIVPLIIPNIFEYEIIRYIILTIIIIIFSSPMHNFFINIYEKIGLNIIKEH